MPRVQADSFLAAPSPEVLSSFAILIAGAERYLIDKSLAAVLERVVTVPGAESFDVETRDAAELTPADHQALVATPPLLNDRRIVVLKDVAAASVEVRDLLKATLAEGPRSLCLIGTGPATMRGTLYAEWEKHGARIVCDLPRKSGRSKAVDFDFPRWLAARAKADFGKRLDREAAEALAETGADLRSLYAELEKVALYVGDSASIGVPDVEAVCAACTTGTVWEWCDAVGAGDADRALKLLRQLLDSGESAYRLVPLLATHFLRLGVVVGLPSRDPQSIMAALPGRTWYGMARSLAEQARRHSPASVARALDRLAAADLMLKSTGHDEEFVMQKHVIEVLRDAA